MEFFQNEETSALDAITYAQWIAHAPIVFQAARVLRDLHILEAIQQAGKNGLTIDEISDRVNVPVYGVTVLVEAGLGSGLLVLDKEKFSLSKAGYFIQNDAMTRVNMDFVQDVCYRGMYNLEDSIQKEKPEGLKIFGSWKTVYEGLSSLPLKVRNSWLAYDHFYSDDAFPKVLSQVFSYHPRKLLDIGGNTGKWSLACRNYSNEIEIGIVDLPGQVAMARENMQKAGNLDRLTFHGMDILNPGSPLPSGYDAIWMSQFLDCFSEPEIISILKQCAEAIDDQGHIFILEPLWDVQRFEAASFSLQQISLYFTAIANGNSRMYKTSDFAGFIEASGLEIEKQINNIGICQSLIVCRKKKTSS